MKEGQKFCPNCGHRLSAVTEKNVSKGSSGDYPSHWNSVDLEGYKRVLAWIVETNMGATLEMAQEILPYMKSHIVIDGDSVKITGEGGPASLGGLLFNLNYLNIMGRNTLTDFGIVPERVKIPDDVLRRIGDKFDAFLSAYASTEEASKRIYNASSPLQDFESDISAIFYKEDVTDLNKLGNYEKHVKKFRENLRKIDFNKFPQTDYGKYVSANDEGMEAVSSINVDASYGKFVYNFSFTIHDSLLTDPERYVAPFFSELELDKLYNETRKYMDECKKNSGFLKSPSESLRKTTLDLIKDFSVKFLAASSSHHVSSNAYYNFNKFDRRRRDIHGLLNGRDHAKLVKEIYELITYANQSYPVLRLISPY